MNEIEKAIAEEESALAKLANPDAEPEVKEPDATPVDDEADDGDNEGGDGGKQDKPVVDADLKDAGDKPSGDDKPEGKEEKLEPSAAAFAKMRRELREAKAKAAALESARTAPAAADVKQTVVGDKKADPADPEPNKQEQYEAWLEWRDRQLEAKAAGLEAKVAKIDGRLEQQDQERAYAGQFQAAVHEFIDIENAYRQENPEYNEAIGHGRMEYLRAAKIMHPDKTTAQIETAIDNQMIQFAAQAAVKGLNPAEELYDLCIERFGYVPKDRRIAEPEVKSDNAKAISAPVAKAKPDLAVIQANKKKSASSLNGGGSGGSQTLTPDDLANMTNAEFSNLSPAQLRELEALGAA